jgi:hypothetical protein
MAIAVLSLAAMCRIDEPHISFHSNIYIVSRHELTANCGAAANRRRGLADHPLLNQLSESMYCVVVARYTYLQGSQYIHICEDTTEACNIGSNLCTVLFDQFKYFIATHSD